MLFPAIIKLHERLREMTFIKSSTVCHNSKNTMSSSNLLGYFLYDVLRCTQLRIRIQEECFEMIFVFATSPSYCMAKSPPTCCRAHDEATLKPFQILYSSYHCSLSRRMKGNEVPIAFLAGAVSAAVGTALAYRWKINSSESE